MSAPERLTDEQVEELRLLVDTGQYRDVLIYRGENPESDAGYIALNFSGKHVSKKASLHGWTAVELEEN